MKLTLCSMAVICSLASSCDSTKPQTAQATAQAAGPASAVIEVLGPAKKRVGSLIHITGRDSVADSLVWYVDTSGVTVPNGGNAELKEKAKALELQGFQVISPSGEEQLHAVVGSEVFIASYAGRVTAVLSCASVSSGEMTQDIAGVSITIGDGNGDPQPPPDKPEPPKPPSQGFGLASSVPAWLATVTDRKNQPTIKSVLETNARLAAEGRFNTLNEIKQSLGAGLAAAVTDVVAWRSFGNSLYTALSKLEAAGKIKTPQQFGQALSEIAGAM